MGLLNRSSRRLGERPPSANSSLVGGRQLELVSFLFLGLSVLWLPNAAAAPRQAAAGQGAPAKQLEVVADAAKVIPITWNRGCGDPPKSVRLPKGTRMERVVQGDEWQLHIGGEPVFGTNVCAGINPTLVVDTQRREGSEWFVSCVSKRVVKATENLETYLRVKKSGLIEVEARSERFHRRGSQNCKVLVERKTVLRPWVSLDADPSDPAEAGAAAAPRSATTPAGTPGATPSAAAPPSGGKVAEAPRTPPGGRQFLGPAPAGTGHRKNLSAGERAQIASEIQKAKRVFKKRVDASPVQIVHQNRMSDDFDVVERHYILDGKALGEEEGARWAKLEPGGLTQVFDDVLPVGVHVLEIEFLYRADDGATNLRVKDAVFFDVGATEPVKVKVTSLEQGNFFTPTASRPKVRFEINGKPPS